MRKCILDGLQRLLLVVFATATIISFCSNSSALMMAPTFSEEVVSDSFRSPLDLSDVSGQKRWVCKENGSRFGSLNNLGKPHAGEDWNWAYEDYGKPLYAIANGIIQVVWNTNENRYLQHPVWAG